MNQRSFAFSCRTRVCCLLKPLDHKSLEMVDLVKGISKIWKYRWNFQHSTVFSQE
jgi:hypothetical protein